ncbi:MAG: hypothetical protein EZS28_043545, partial [Streblomastix strix]
IDAPYGDSFVCAVINQAFSTNLHGLLGFKVKATAKANIAPSATWLLANGPTGIEYVKDGKEVPAELQSEFKNSSISSSCKGESIVYATYTISRGGIVDSSCIPNTKQPEDITQCEDKSVPLVYLNKSAIGRFYKSDSATVKQLLLRFGVVQIKERLIIGWEGSNWIYADRGTDKYSWSTLAIDSTTTNFEGRVIVAESDELIDCLITPNDPFCVSEMDDQTGIVRAAFCLIAGALILPALTLLL